MCDHHLFLVILPNDWNNSNSLNNNEKANAIQEGNDGETPQSKKPPVIIEPTPSKSISLCQLFKINILEKYGLTETATWILSSNKKHYEITFVSEFGVLCEELLCRLTEIGIGQLPETRVAVLPLTYATGYDKSSASVTIGFQNQSTSDNLKLEETMNDSSINDPKNKNTLPSALPAPKANQRRKSIRTEFLQSIRSRLMVFQVVQAIRAQSALTFDFLVLLAIASILAALGLLENSSVILVASMLISPLMGPILAMVFGLCIHDRSLCRTGFRSEFLGLFVCLISGFSIGIITSTLETSWGSSSSFPTPEMKARGDLTRLSIGSMIALPSGAGVALSVLGGNAGSLVGVAISASLLPPAVNSGLLLSYSLLTAAFPKSFGRYSNETYILIPKFYPNTKLQCKQFLFNDYRSIYSCNMTMEAFILAIVSFLLTLVNIICIVVCAFVVLRVKEVAPSGSEKETGGSETDRFFHDDMRRFRNYQKTIHNTQDLVDDDRAGLQRSSQDISASKRERLKQLLALASLHDLDLTNQHDLTLNNAEARLKVKQLYKTMLQFDKDAKRLDIGLKNSQPLPTLMMDVLPPKWTELFLHEEDQAMTNEHGYEQRSIGSSRHSCQWHNSAMYNTYHEPCTIHTKPKRFSCSPQRIRTYSCGSNASVLEPLSIIDNENETLLRGTRFRLAKATINRFDDNYH